MPIHNKPLLGAEPCRSFSIPDSIRGFTAEPRSISQRPHPNPAGVQTVSRRITPRRERGDGVCSFCEIAARPATVALHNGCAVDPNPEWLVRSRAAFPPRRLTVQDPGLSSPRIRVQLPSRRPFSFAVEAKLAEAPACRAGDNSSMSLSHGEGPGAIPGGSTTRE